MAATCPDGHPSASTDYCDVCGTPMAASGEPGGADASGGGPAAGASSGGPAAAAAPTPCPNCRAVNSPDALFCEACGYDYTTGAMPRDTATERSSGVLDLDTPAPEAAASAPAAASPEIDLEWVAEVWIDPEWYAMQQAPDPLPSPGLPTVVPLRRRSLLIGRPSRSRNIAPDVDCEPDSGTSRRQAQLTTDGTRWFVEDLESANGTYVAATAAPLPQTPIPVGRRHELQTEDRIFVGAWTRIVLRRVLPEEKELYS